MANAASACAAAGDIGEFALEGSSDRKAVAPFRFGGRRGQRGVAPLNIAITCIDHCPPGLPGPVPVRHRSPDSARLPNQFDPIPVTLRSERPEIAPGTF